MPTNRVRRRRDAAPAVSAQQWALLRDEPPPPGDLLDDFEAWCFAWPHPGEPPWGAASAEGLWHDHGQDVLRDWRHQHPGTRPSCWWRFESPGPRVRVGGIGTPSHERLAYALELRFGVPVHWITARDIASYEMIGRPLDVPPVGLKNPPRYEAEATYLDRHGLLLLAERRRLDDADFEPEAIGAIFGWPAETDDR